MRREKPQRLVRALGVRVAAGGLLGIGLALVGFGASPAVAQEMGEQRVATSMLTFLKIGLGARAGAVGEAFTPVADDATTMHWNPAGLALLEGRHVHFSHTEWPADIDYEAVFVTVPVAALGGGVGLQVASLRTTLDYTTELEPLPEGRTFGYSVLRTLWPADGITAVAMPLRDRNGETVGALALFVPGGERPSDTRLAFAEALSGTAAVAIETQRLLEAHKALLDAFIRLVAGAIDAKSPYTGGHCQRVPELTQMLARAACDAQDGPFRDFSLSEEDWEALQIASWLHDCGKVTTPEYVVDKATKLETIYDRIHEVRMRFEVLKRDAEIAYLRQVAGGGDASALRSELRAAARRARRGVRFRRELQRTRDRPYLALHDLSQPGIGLLYMMAVEYDVLNIGVTPDGRKRAAEIIGARPDWRLSLALVVSYSLTGRMAKLRVFQPDMEEFQL